MANKNFGRFVRTALAVLALSTSQFVSAEVVAGDYIKLDASPAGNLGGGAFSGIEITSAGSVIAGEKSFYTFCLEYYEHFTPGNTLYVKNVSNATLNSTSSFYTTNNSLSGGTANSDPLSAATEWLFTKFSTNSISRTSILANDASANSFQRAIWYLEKELTGNLLTDYNNDTAAKKWVADANAEVLGGWTDVGNQVRVLNLMSFNSTTKKYDINAQDQIYFVATPVPEVETYAMMLAGLGLMGTIARRRKNKSA